MARLLNRLLLIALERGMLPMNEYAVVKEQAKGEVIERTPFTHRPETVGVSTLLRKIFFQVWRWQGSGFGNRLMACPFQAADLPGGQSPKNMKPEPPLFESRSKYIRLKKLFKRFPCT